MSVRGSNPPNNKVVPGVTVPQWLWDQIIEYALWREGQDYNANALMNEIRKVFPD